MVDFTDRLNKEVSRESTRRTRIIFRFDSCAFAKFAAAFVWLLQLRNRQNQPAQQQKVEQTSKDHLPKSQEPAASS
jgi:hypothetical protein